MNIKILICDVDGTLTDNKAIYDNLGNCSKSFSVLDGMGFGLLKNSKIDIAWITGSKEPCIKYRAEHCGIEKLFMGIHNKKECVENCIISNSNGIEWNNIAYIGDDLNDLDCIARAGLSAVPNNAIIKSLNRHSYTCQRKGGEGAVREFIDKILSISINRYW